MSCNLKIQKPFKEFLRILSLAILYVCIMGSIIYTTTNYPEFMVVTIIGLIVIFLSCITILTIIDKLVRYKESKPGKSIIEIFKMWFSEHIISCEKSNE